MMDFPNLSGRAVKTIVAFPHPLFHPPDLRSLKRPVNSLQGTVADPGDDRPPPPPLTSRSGSDTGAGIMLNKSVTQSYIDHSRHHESKWHKIIFFFWLAPTLCQFQCSNCLYCKIRLLCRLTYKGIVCHPFSPLTGYLHLTCVSKESASWYFVVLLSKLHPPFLNLNFIHFWKYSVTNLTCPISPLELHFAIHVIQNHQLMSKGYTGRRQKI